MKKWLSAFVLISSLAFSACSLKYDEGVSVEDKVPELVFYGAEFTRYTDASPTFRLSADHLEQYKDNGASYAENASFSTWNKEREIDTEGSCGFLSLDAKNKVYSLFNEINVKSQSQNMEISAENLRWNGNTEQLTASAGETVFIKKDGLEMEGSGFSASGISNSFSFKYEVSGIFTDTDSDPQTQDDENKVEAGQ